MSDSKPILIWDWDGTLVDTITYKYNGIWGDIFPGDFEKQRVVKEFLSSPEGRGTNRYGLVQKALGLDSLSEEELRSDKNVTYYVAQYKKLSKESVLRNGTYPGTEEVLEKLFNNGYSMYIISGGGTDEDLKDMVESVSVAKYFKGIYGFGLGSFTSFGKRENFERVVSKEGETDPGNYIVIGDSISDYEFSKNIGARFIGFIRPWNNWKGYENLKLLAGIEDLDL